MVRAGVIIKEYLTAYEYLQWMQARPETKAVSRYLAQSDRIVETMISHGMTGPEILAALKQKK